MAINKVIFGNTTLMDTTGVTVTPDKMVLGTTALSASGDTITGTLGPATQSTDGLMSATDKAKLDDANACAKVGPSAVASFTDAYAADALDITIGIEPVQSGSGDPSPTNVRPISGWTGANVVVSPTTDAQDGTTYQISWQAEAGTVYGGTLDVTTGLLTVDRASKTFDGSETWEWRSNTSLGRSDVSGGVITDGVTQFNKYVTNCDLFKTESWVEKNGTGTVGMFYGQSQIYLKYDGFTSADDIKTFLAANPMTVVYELATPQTYQLTPTQIALLEGVNNVWADTGGTTVTYLRADSLCINRAIAARLDGLDMLGFYIDNSGYICQRIGSDT